MIIPQPELGKEMTLNEIQSKLDSIKHPEELFGFDITRKDAVKVFKKYKHLTHEDKFVDSDKYLARDLFIKINKLWNNALYKFSQGTYGNVDTTPIGDKFIISSKENSYEITGSFVTGNLCNVYHTDNEVVKITKTHKDNDLLDNEATVLSKLCESKDGDHILVKTIPKLIESFSIRTDSKEKRQVNIIQYHKDYMPLSKIMKLYPEGLDPRHIIWIWKRLLMTLGFVHKEKIIHGCINPDNILINPVDHSVILIDWCYSVTSGSPLKLIDAKYKGYYIKKVFDKQGTSEKLDLYMVAKTISEIVDMSKCPKTMYNTIKSALYNEGTYDNAWKMYDIIDDLASHLYGAGTFVELKV